MNNFQIIIMEEYHVIAVQCVVVNLSRNLCIHSIKEELNPLESGAHIKRIDAWYIKGVGRW
jgi:hypothetical protein